MGKICILIYLKIPQVKFLKKIAVIICRIKTWKKDLILYLQCCRIIYIIFSQYEKVMNELNSIVTIKPTCVNFILNDFFWSLTLWALSILTCVVPSLLYNISFKVSSVLLSSHLRILGGYIFEDCLLLTYRSSCKVFLFFRPSLKILFFILLSFIFW